MKRPPTLTASGASNKNLAVSYFRMGASRNQKMVRWTIFPASGSPSGDPGPGAQRTAPH